MAKFQQKYERDNFEETVGLSERDLWVAVLARAALDALKDPPVCHRKTSASAYINYFHYNKDQAVHFLTQGGKHFNEVCQMAGRNPTYIKEKVIKLLQQQKWEPNIPITFRYRDGPKRRRKKQGLTGNAYYAAKAKEEIHI